MYYLFTDLDTDKFIQLTFNGQLVATCTEWTENVPEIAKFESAFNTCDSWSTLDEWLSHDTFRLLTTSPNPITPFTHPEFSI